MSDIKFDYSLEPGRTVENINKYENGKPIISVIIPCYNEKKYIEQSVKSVLNQTFPFYEIIIVDDGSTDAESLEELEKIEKMDERIIVHHKKNGGLAETRDYGAKKASDSSRYFFFFDADDLIDKTYLECAYWTLETNKDASWAYADSVGFDYTTYTWQKWFDSDSIKKCNTLVATALIRREAFEEVNGYGLREKAVNEDWNFWLKLIAKGKFPVKMNFIGFWYRRKNQGELVRSVNNKKRTMDIIKNTIKTIKGKVKAIQYPLQTYKGWEKISETLKINEKQIKQEDKIRVLMMVPWLVTGGADKFDVDLLKGLDKNKYDITLIFTEPNVNVYRQEVEQFATVYDLTTFLNEEYWLAFINYIIKSNNINLIFNTNCKTGYAMVPYLKAKYPEVPIMDYIHMEEWYNRNGGYSRDSSAVASVIDKTLVCNGNSKKVLEEYFKRESNEIETVYIGVNENEYDPSTVDKEKLRKKYKLENENRYIISYICRISEQKRPYLFMEIVKETIKNRKDILFLVAGDGNLLNSIKQKAREYKIDKSIIFLGNIKNTKEIYAISDLTLNCSIKEGLALTSYESLAMGVPVVSSDVGGQKELIDSSVGAIVECKQKETDINNTKYEFEEINSYVISINEIVDNLDKYKENCRKRILNGFTINHMISKMDSIMKEIAKKPSLVKVENGKNMSSNIEIAKEVINYSFIANRGEYAWLCDEYNRKVYGAAEISKIIILRETLWSFKLWRIMIKVLQKIGIIRLLKSMRNQKGNNV